MEPAVKPASEKTKSGKVGVLATQGTFKSERYCSLVERFAGGIEVFENPCIGLVELIESGKMNHQNTKTFMAKIVEPMIEKEIDAIVLGCTHYPFIQPILKEILPNNIQIINPAPAVARHTRNRLKKLGLLAEQTSPSIQFYTTGHPINFQKQIKQLINIEATVKGLRW